MTGEPSEIDLLERFGVYVENPFGREWCYKWQPYGADILIVSDIDQKKAASNMFIELLKAIHYEMKYARENNKIEWWVKNILPKYKKWDDINVDKTIEIANRQYKIFEP